MYSHRVYSLQAVERPPQSLCYDDGKPGDDDGNPYTVILSAAKDLCVRRARPFPFAALRAAAHALRVTGIISKCLALLSVPPARKALRFPRRVPGRTLSPRAVLPRHTSQCSAPGAAHAAPGRCLSSPGGSWWPV